MPLGSRYDRCVSEQLIFVMALIVSTQHQLVHLQPVLNSVLRGAQANHRFAARCIASPGQAGRQVRHAAHVKESRSALAASASIRRTRFFRHVNVVHQPSNFFSASAYFGRGHGRVVQFLAAKQHNIGLGLQRERAWPSQPTIRPPQKNVSMISFLGRDNASAAEDSPCQPDCPVASGRW